MASRFQFRRATASLWTSANPILAEGELGYETDTGKFKIGDGSTAWTTLKYSIIDATTAPILYNATTRNISLSYGTGLTLNGSNQLVPNFGTTSGTVTQGNDSRLSDARTPTAHASTHGSAGSDPVTIANTQVTGLGTSSTRNVPATGNAATTEVVLGSDTRLTDSRTPTGTAGAGGGDLTGTYPSPSLIATGTAGTYTKVTTDSKGRVTSGTTATASDVGAVPTTRTLTASAPLTIGGTIDTTLDLSANRTLGVRAASTTVTGVVQLSDSTSTTSSVLAATPTAVKAAYDLAAAATPKSSPSFVASFSRSGTLVVGTGTFRWYNDSGATLTIGTVRASVGTASAGASIICDINVNGTTIYATQTNRPTIAAAGVTTTGGTKSTTTIASGSYLTVDIDQVGSTTAGADLGVHIWLSYA